MREEWRRGWPVVAGVAAAIATGGSLFQYVSSLFIPGLSAEFGWTRGDIGAIAAMAGFGALLAPVIGWAADRFGVKPVAGGLTLVLAALYLGLTIAETLNQFRNLAIGIGFVILASTSLVLARPIVQWFDRGRGLALGLSLVGVSVSAILVPPLVHELIAAHGWRAGYYTLAALAAFVCVPVILLYVNERPGFSHRVPLGQEEAASVHGPMGVALTWRAMVQRRDFWLLCGALFCLNLAGAGILSQLAVLLTDRGVDGRLAASAISLYAAAIIVGRLGCGFLLDRLPSALVACVFTLLPAIGCTLLLIQGLPLAAMALAVFMAGLQQGSESDVMAFFIARQFGLVNFSAVFGYVVMTGAVGTALSSLMFGLAHDRTGSYDAALFAATAFFTLGAGTLLAIGPAPVKAP